MDRQAILERLYAEAPSLRQKHGVKSLAVFGSMARGDDREGSDVDVLVTFEGKGTFDNSMGLKLDLQDLFGRSVGLLTPKCLSPETTCLARAGKWGDFAASGPVDRALAA